MQTAKSFFGSSGFYGAVTGALTTSVLALAILTCFPLPLVGGQGGSAVKGTLQDSTGAPVPGVTVKLRNVAAGTEQTDSTDEDGFFEFRALPAGKYVLAIAAQGFEPVTEPVEVGATPPRPLRVRLELAQVKQQVTVSAAADAVPSAQQNVDYVQLDQGLLHDLPAKDGDPLAIPSLFLDPAAVGAQGPQLIVDGVESSALEIPMASVREVAVNKSPYSAEFSRPGRGRIEVTTRRGSHHRYRGLVSLLVRNSALDARNPFAATLPELERGIGEGQLSGPLTRHTTFFVAGQYYTDDQASVITAVTPTGILNENSLAPQRRYYAFGRLDYDHHGRRLTVAYKYKDKSKRDQNVGGFNLPQAATDYLDRENGFRIYETDATSPNWLNSVRFSLIRQPQDTHSDSNLPAIVVPGAFTAGGAQVDERLVESAYSFQDEATWIKGRHTVQFGGGVRHRLFDVKDASNFGGTFYFPSLVAFEANQPLLYTLNQGVPDVSFPQIEYFSYIQDEIRLRRNLSLSLGLREELQSNVRDYHNFAPRLALAYAPRGGRTVIRAGAGAFYDRQPETMEEQALLYNGLNIRQIVIPNPPYPSPFGSSPPASFATPSVTRLAPGVVTPRLYQANVSVERRLGKGENFLTLDFTTLRGLNLYRLRNVNAPLPGTMTRPDPNFININQFESSGTSRSNSLTVTYRTTLRNRVNFLAQYVLSKSLDDTDGILPSATSELLFFPVNTYNLYPANSYDLSGEWGRSDFDRRHRFNMMVFYRMPHGFKSGAVVNLSSGVPYNITTGFDNNHDNVLNDRPPGVGRNTGEGPGYADVDLHFSKEFSLPQISETTHMELGVDAFNVFNRVNYKDFVGTLTSPFFGRANAAQAARQLQLSFRIKF